MALRSVLDIDVNDSAFIRYQEQFKKYTDLLAQTPDAWTKVTKEIDASRKSFQELVAAAAARQGYARLTAEAEGVAARSTEQQARAWGDMARSTRLVAGNIIDATRSLLRWAGVTTAISGLLGAGGLWGIDRLAISAAGQRLSSTGLGVSAGEQSAFNLVYGGHLGGSEGILGGVNAALTNPAMLGGLFRAGLTGQDIAGKDAAQVSVTLINKLKQLADQTPTQLLGSIVGSRGLGQFGVDEQFLRRLKDRSAAEIAGYGPQYASAAAATNLTPGQLTAWENFRVQLDTAGRTIETTLIGSLTDLTKPLGKLSDAFTHLITTLLGSDPAKNLIDDLASGLNSFAETVSSGSFRKDITAFVEDIGVLTKAIHTALGWIPEIIKFNDEHQLNLVPKEIPPGDLGPDGSYSPGHIWDWLKSHLSGTAGIAPLGFGGGGGGGLLHYASYNPSFAGSGGGGNPGQFGGIEAQDNLPGGLLNSVYGAESGYGRNIGPSSAGALGPFQFLPSTWRTYGRGGNPLSLSDASQAAGRYLQKLLDEFKGDVAKAVAAYNWGEGNVERDVARWGSDWRSHLPGETQRYLQRVLPGVSGAQGQHMAVRIYNNTGGSAIVQASAMAG